MTSDREQDGWFGPVQFVVVEVADFFEQGGTQTLGPRMPLFSQRYDGEGKRVEERTYCLHRESGVGDCVTRQDSDGNINAIFCFSNGDFQHKVIPTYDSNKRVIKETFCDLFDKPHCIREHKYDATGNSIEMSYTEANGKIVDKLKYENEYDSFGNLIKVTVFRWRIDDGKSFYKPSSIHYKTITYY